MTHKFKSPKMKVCDNFLMHFIMISLLAHSNTFKLKCNAMKDKWSMSELIAMCVQENGRLKLGQPKVVHLTTTANSIMRKDITIIRLQIKFKG